MPIDCQGKNETKNHIQRYPHLTCIHFLFLRKPEVINEKMISHIPSVSPQEHYSVAAEFLSSLPPLQKSTSLTIASEVSLM
jgi:hypothetical protein